jgi:hypothetical protein
MEGIQDCPLANWRVEPYLFNKRIGASIAEQYARAKPEFAAGRRWFYGNRKLHDVV